MLFALTLLGCTAWIDQEPACDQDVYWWSDDLLAHILMGDGSGEFDYDPIDDPRESLDGEYDTDDGDFSWTEKFDSDYYLRRNAVEGFGTVYHNGNLDLLFTETVTDMLDETWGTVFRVQRDECDMTIATWDAEADIDSALVMVGSYEDEAVWSWEAEVEGYTYTGALRQSLQRTNQIEADDGSYWAFTSATPDGETEQEWNGACGDGLNCEGTSTRHFDGTLEESYVAYDGGELYAEIEGEFAYDQSGEQTIVYYLDGDTTTCTYTYESAEDCSYECDDGSDGAC